MSDSNVNALQVRNQMSAKAFMATENNEPIDILPSKKEGKFFFVCGSTKGYIKATTAQKAINDANFSLDDLQFAEVSKDNGATFVPTLMLKSTANVLRRFTAQ